jgi:NAD-dependent deacetylase
MAALPQLARYRRVVFFTGAGLSAESGIPTYRGAGGMWAQYNYEEFACERAFQRTPEKVWDFHDKRRSFVAGKEPNLAHRLIADVVHKQGAQVITQNIDGLHQRSGVDQAVELHGSLWRVRCPAEGTVTTNNDLPINRRCACGGYLRPDIVWFEDSLSALVLDRAEALLRACDLIVSIGTSGVVYPAADLPRIAKQVGATTVEINLEDTPVSHLFEHRLRGPASEVLPLLLNEGVG